VEDADQGTFEKIKSEAERLQVVQIAYRDEKMRADRLEIENDLLLEKIIKRMLTAAGPCVHIEGNEGNVMIVSGGSSVNAQQTVDDPLVISKVLDTVMNRFAELSIAHDQAEQLAKVICDLQSELKRGSPRNTVVSKGLDFIIGALSNAVGTALASNNWSLLLDQLKHIAKSLPVDLLPALSAGKSIFQPNALRRMKSKRLTGGEDWIRTRGCVSPDDRVLLADKVRISPVCGNQRVKTGESGRLHGVGSSVRNQSDWRNAALAKARLPLPFRWQGHCSSGFALGDQACRASV
jgi:hypothetical protein